MRRLVGLQAVSANRLSDDLGVSQETLSRWLREARNVNGMTKPARPVGRPSRKPKWSGAEKLCIVMAAHGLSETELGAFLRREGLLETQLREWRAAAEAALNAPPLRTESSRTEIAPHRRRSCAATRQSPKRPNREPLAYRRRVRRLHNPGPRRDCPVLAIRPTLALWIHRFGGEHGARESGPPTDRNHSTDHLFPVS